MSLLPHFYRFHDIAAIEVCSESPFVRRFFEAEYRYHSVETRPEGLPYALLNFRLDPSIPKGFTPHVHKILARWGYRLTINPGKIEIFATGNHAAVPMVHHMLVHPSLRWLAAKGGTLLLHAGAVSKNGRSLILTGKGGAGKTTITSLILASQAPSDGALLENEWQIHADDYVFLRGGKSLACVMRSHLYRDLLKWVPGITVRLTPWERIRLEFLGAVRRYTREQLKWAVRLDHSRLWPGRTIADSAKPAAILLLERSDTLSPAVIPLEDRIAVGNELLEMNFAEAHHFLYLLQKAGRFDEQWLDAWKDAEHALLANFLVDTPAYRFIMPSSQSPEDLKRVLLPILERLVAV